MNEYVQEYINILTNIKTESDRLKELAEQYSENTNDIPHIIYNGKFVAKDLTINKVVRAESLYSINRRLGIHYKALEADISEIFLEESKIFEQETYGITTQDILPFWNEEYSEDYLPEHILYGNQIALSCRLNQDYPDKYETIYEFFNTYQIQGISGRKAGIDSNGKIKIFDWFGNYHITNDGNIITNG